MCLCVRQKIGGGEGEWEREGHCCCYDPLGLPGLDGEGRERGSVWKIYSQKKGLAYGEESWLTEHLDTNTKTCINQPWQLSLLTFHYFSSAWCPETKSCTTFNPCQCHLTENLSNCWITQSVISSEANSGALDFFLLWSGYFSFEVVNSPWALFVDVMEEKQRVDKEEL